MSVLTKIKDNRAGAMPAIFIMATTGHLRYDIVKIEQNGEPAELQILSETKDVVDSFLVNVADGLSKWGAPTLEARVDDGYHTAFGVSMLAMDGSIVIGQSEGTGHPLVAGTVPVVYRSLNNGQAYTKTYLSLTGISGAANDDIRNLAGGMEISGKLWLFATDYINAAEVVAPRLWYWVSTDNGSTWSDPTEITYNTTTYNELTTYGQLVDLGGGVLIVPAYGYKGNLAESYAVQLKSIDGGVTWTASNMYTGDISTGSDYITETFIKQISGNNLIAIGRRELTTPRLLSSSNAGITWVNEGVLSGFPSNLIHAPWIYQDETQVSCIYSDRTGLNVGRMTVYQNYTDDAEWNAAIPEVVAGSVTQRGFGAYNFGYCSTVGTGRNRMMVWYDISLNEDTPASLINALTAIILTPLVMKPCFIATMANTTTTGGSEDDIYFDSTLIAVDNYGGMERVNFKKYTVQQDGFYNIQGNVRVGVQGFATYTQLTCYSNFPSTAYNDIPIMQGGCIGQGFGFISMSGVRQLRKGEEIYFKLYTTASSPAINFDSAPVFSIMKLD